MKTNFLLAGPALLILAVCGESALGLIVKIVELLGLAGLFAAKFAASVSLCSWLASSLIESAHGALGDGRFLAFLVLHAALWFAKIFLLFAVFSGQGK